MVAFVILHYNDIKVTIQSVESLLKLQGSEACKIIIVDNGSKNDTGMQLKDRYNNDSRINVIINDKNLGFAKGNNLGYKFVKKEYDVSYVIVMNNDVIINQNDFIYTLENNNFDKYEVIMPAIINKEGYNQNPYRFKPQTDKEINYILIKKIILSIIYNIPFINRIWLNRSKREIVKSKKCEDCEMMIPHGACVIFSKRWIKKEDFAFVPETFMYGEEDILYEYILNRKYKTFYSNSLEVNHLEDVATDSIIKSSLKKAKFQVINSIKPMIILKKIRRANNKKIIYKIKEEEN